MTDSPLPPAPALPALPAALERIAALERALALAQDLAAAAAQQRDAVLSHLPGGVLLLDSTGCVVLLNGEYCRQMGLELPEAQWLGVPARALAERVQHRFADPAGFVADALRVWQAQLPQVGTELRLADGGVLERDALPVEYNMGTGFLVTYRDVTARHRHRQALRDVSLVPEQNPSPIIRLNAAGDPTYANAAARRLPGQLPPGTYDGLLDRLRAAAREALGTQQRQQLEVAAGPVAFQAEIVPVPAEGYVNLYLGDVTEHRAVEERLAAQRAFYEAILDGLPAEVVVVDDARRYRYLNPTAQPDPALRRAAPGQTLTEYDRAQGRPADYTAQRLARYARARAGAPQEWSEAVDRPGGPRHFLRRLQLVAATAEAAGFFIGYGLDVTDREQARQELAAERDFTRQVLDTTPSVIYVRDEEANFLFQNRASRQLLAEALYAAPAPAGTPRAEEAARYAAVDAQVLAQGTEVVVEDELTMPDGSVRCYQTVKRPLHRSGGAVHVLGVSTDITSLKAAQLAAEAAATARQNFLANMSHEIRTPLNGVLGMAAQLAKTRLDPRQQELTHIIHTSGQHLLGIINDVLDMAKISSGQVEFERAAFNLCESMGAALEPLARQAAAKGLAFHCTPLRESCPYPWVLGDARRLNQVMLNLVGNAVKFTPQGAVTVASECLRETDDELVVRFSVADTGIGIAAERQAHVFESFAQAYADTNRRYGGTGLGLSISRTLVAQLGGTLALSSTEGQGSTFAFTLALPKAPVRADLPPPAGYDTGRLAGVRVLLVEDNDTNRAVARLTVAPWGVVLDEAVDGPAGLALLEAHRYDLVLMDVQMPGLSGVGVTQRLRQLPDPARAATPVLALSANAFQDDIDEYLAAGMTDYLAKPYAEEVLYRKMVALLDPVAPAPLYDLAQLRRQAQGRPAFVAQILRSVLAHAPDSLAQLREAAAARRWAAAAAVAHHLRPNLLLLGVAGAVPPLRVLALAHRAAPGTPPAEAAFSAAAAQLLAVVGEVLAALPAELAALPEAG